MKRILFYALFLLLAGVFIHAAPSHQTRSVNSHPKDSTVGKTILSGIVYSAKQQIAKKPIDSASLSVMERRAPHKKLAEVKTDVNGFYEVDLSPYGVAEVIIVASAKGHDGYAGNVVIHRGTTIKHDVKLEVTNNK